MSSISQDMKEDRHWKFHWTELYKTGYFWATSDFVKNPIPESVWENVREMFLHGKARDMILDPFGRKMGEISEYELPFLQRKGNLYNIQYLVKWLVNGDAVSKKHINRIRTLYRMMNHEFHALLGLLTSITMILI